MEAESIIVTNNPQVAGRIPEKYPQLAGKIDYRKVSFKEILLAVRDEVHQGAELLTHPLDGSVKPQETPYKSVLIRKRRGSVDIRSLELIESAIASCDKFKVRERIFDPQVQKDFQTIDRTLLESALSSWQVTDY